MPVPKRRIRARPERDGEFRVEFVLWFAPADPHDNGQKTFPPPQVAEPLAPVASASRASASPSSSSRSSTRSASALVAVGRFFSLVFYFGWEGGQVGEALAEAFVFVFGKVAYLMPLALLGAGAAVIFHPLLEDVPPLRTGAILLLAALTLGYGAGALGLGPEVPERTGTFDSAYFTEHGGLVGETLYVVISTLFQRIGAHLAFVFMFASGVLLLTGASIAAVVQATGGALRGAGRSFKRQTHEFGQIVIRERERAKADAALRDNPYVDGDPDHDDEMRIHALHEQEPLVPPDLEGETEEVEAVVGPEPVVVPGPDQGVPVAEADLTPQGARRSGVTESEQLATACPTLPSCNGPGGGAGPIPRTRNRSRSCWWRRSGTSGSRRPW